MDIYQIFPDPIYFSTLERELTKGELNTINKFKIRTLINKDEEGYNYTNYSNVKTRQSVDHQVLEKKGLSNLKKDLNKAILDYFDRVVCSSNPITPYITLSWLNYTQSNETLHRHAHPNSFVSGVFYIDADKKVDKIIFHKGDYERIRLESKRFNVFNSPSWWFPIEKGKIVLFPSHLIHGVENKQGTNRRLSLAFNVFLKGRIGNANNLTELVLG